MKKLVIVKRYDRKFRIPLYDILGERLEKDDIRLEIIYGQPDREEVQTIKDIIEENRWGEKVRNKYFYFGSRSLCWQPVISKIKDADLVIVQQGNRELLNYVLQIRRIFKKKPLLAFWGHGMNFQANQDSLVEKFKAFYSQYVDYWFAYNDLSRELMLEKGFDKDKIFSLQNTIDSKEEMKLYESITEEELESLRSEYKIHKDATTGIYCGSLYAHKRIEFLVKTLLHIKEEIKDFHFFIVGDGILREKLKELIKGNEDWIHFTASQYGRDKLKFFRLASFQLIPGLVGLNIIDSFITLTPLITTRNKLHSPEISYLKNYENGIITENTLEDYSNTVLKLIKDPELQQKLSEGCDRARKIYTIDNMADNFYRGIKTILKEDRK
jgi:glycosyltransferase involved in cell wall biosynthesis